MKKPNYLLAAALFVVLLGVPFSSRSQQDSSGSSEDQVRLRHNAAVNLVRVINTAEATHHGQQGSYVTWDGLRTTTDFSPFLTHWGSRIGLPPAAFPGRHRKSSLDGACD